MKWTVKSPALLLILLSLAVFPPPAHAKPALVIGSKRFPESEILGAILTQMARQVGEAQVTNKSGLGNTGIVFAALKSGSIDIYPEYTGTISEELLKDPTPVGLSTINRQLAPMGLAAGVPLGFNDGYGLAMRDSEAQRLGITTISQLAQHPGLKLGLSQEFLGRADGWAGLKAAYHLPFATPQGFDHGAAYRALASGQTDVADVYTTDAEIQQYHLRVLTDNLHYFPLYNAVLLYRANLPARLPKTWGAFQTLQGKISAPLMISMNAEINIGHRTPDAVAADFLAGKITAGQPVKMSRASFWQVLFAPDLWRETQQQLFLVFASLALSILLGVPLGIWAARVPRASHPILGVVGVIQTIPSLALLAFLVPIFSIGTVPTIIALFLYSLLPIVRNTYTGLTDISPSLRESATALGLPPGARLRLVELPLAARSILAGIKTSAVINVGTATIAAFIGAGGYGDRINEGLQTYDNAMLLSGAIPAAVMALVIQYGFDLLDRFLIPSSLRSSG
jgi:osmoprotectant transport system permease protein